MSGEVKSLPEFAIFVAKNKELIDLSALATNDLNGVVKKTNSDADGELYQLDNFYTTKLGVFGKDKEYEDYFFSVLKSMNRFQFSSNYDELTIKNQVSTLQFKRFVPVKAPQKTNELQG